MHSLGKLGFRRGGLALFMAVLLGLLVFPHESFGAERDCSACAAGLECANLCDCSDHAANCSLDTLPSHEFRNDAAQSLAFNLAPLSLVCMILLPDSPQWELGLLNSTIGFASRSFVIRHLDTIILRV